MCWFLKVFVYAYEMLLRMFYLFDGWQGSTVCVCNGLILVTDLEVWCLQMRVALPNELLWPGALGVLQPLCWLFLLFSSWVIVTSQPQQWEGNIQERGHIMRDPHFEWRTETYSGELLACILWRVTLVLFFFLPPRHVLGCLLQLSHDFILLLKKPQALISFLTEILRGNKRRFYFGVCCSLVSPAGVFRQYSIQAAAAWVAFLCSIALLGQGWPQ